MNLPNKLTILRMIMIPFFVACFYLPDSWNAKLAIAAILFILAYVTDAVDGHIARKYNLVTDFGKFMDPIADKLLTAAAIIFMLRFELLPNYFGEAFVFLTISREFIVSGFRLVAAGKGTVIAADKLGKIKTVLQFITIAVILLDGYLLNDKVISCGTVIKYYVDVVLICITLILTVWSMINYIVKNKQVLLQVK